MLSNLQKYSLHLNFWVKILTHVYIQVFQIPQYLIVINSLWFRVSFRNLDRLLFILNYYWHTNAY